MASAPDSTSSGALSLTDAGPAVVRQIVVAFGAARGDRDVVVLDGRPLIVGRDEADATLALDDDQVSRRHVEIAFDASADAWAANDLGSRNGTYVDGARAPRAILRHGAVIRAGRSLLVYTEAPLGDRAGLRPEAPPLFGPSLAMQRVRGDIERVARSGLPVLVLGETGVGKELAAAAIHAESGRRGPFVPVNCAAIADSVAEAELFGHEPGAFTGAAQRREGLIAAADGGTLFLDEIGELPATLQPKLLRALALGEVRPVGSSRPRRIDVRVVAATHRDLAAAERAGTFRGDLLARLSGWTLAIPPLRARREDVLPLARRFLRARPGAPELSTSAAEALLLYPFPHNVRELEHELAAAIVRWDGRGPLTCDHLGDRIGAPMLARRREQAPTPAPARAAPDDLREVVARFHGNLAQVAAHYGKDRRQVYRWIERAGIDPKSFRPA